MDEGDTRARTRTPIDTPAYTIAVFLPRNQQSSSGASHVSASVCGALSRCQLQVWHAYCSALSRLCEREVAKK